ncbi:NfeD family protein [candidate division TA06 bacterium]|nr:NfeD family protein [candidate division TA06 bacterium]
MGEPRHRRSVQTLINSGATTHWRAWSDAEIAEGTKIKVVAVKGMTLKVTISG